MTKNEISEIKKLLSSSKKIVIVPHKNPDGDAMGSSLGLYHYLIDLGHTVTVITPNDYPNFLKWLPGDEFVMIFEGNLSYSKKRIEEADLIFTLDFNDLSRTGDMAPFLEQSEAIKILIDHHQEPKNYAQYI